MGAERETVAERNERVWEHLFMRREQGDRDPLLAAQEHYAYARMDVSTSGVPGFVRDLVLVPAYEAAKLVVSADVLKTGAGEVSPASVDSLLSGWKGAYDGLADYLKGTDQPASSTEAGDHGRGPADAPRSVDSMGLSPPAT
jgi:hypothetical protein